jgi:DnaJ-class molecular chaperone
MHMSNDPFATLGVDENAGDEPIRRRYLELVRAWPPDREPEKFQALREAYEAISGPRQRAAWKLLHTSTAALSHLKLHCLTGSEAQQRRPTEAAMTALLLDSLQHTDL